MTESHLAQAILSIVKIIVTESRDGITSNTLHCINEAAFKVLKKNIFESHIFFNV